MTDAVRAILDQTESDMRALNLWDYRLKSVQAGNVQRLITDIRAALSEQPAHPAPVERVTLTDEQIDAAIIASTRKEECIADACKQVRWVPYHHTRVIARAVIAEYEHINSGAVRQPLTDAQIINLRDDLLPSQGDSFDCIAFARAIETKHGITA